MKNIVLAALLLGLHVLTAGGCLVMSVHSIDESGTQVSSPTLEQVEPGVTSESWLLAALGEPTTRRLVQQTDPRTEILTYRHRTAEKHGTTVFLIFAGSRQKVSGSTMYFEIADGIVTRFWQEPVESFSTERKRRRDESTAG
jgi:hypothetical protein